MRGMVFQKGCDPFSLLYIAHEPIIHVYNAINEIKDFFESTDKENATFVLMYSGHGTPPQPPRSNQGGNWIFHDGFISLEDILGIWSSSLAFQVHKYTHLVIIIDACFSGCWVERLKDSRFRKYRVMIQASSKADQESEDTKFGDAFLCYWLKKLTGGVDHPHPGGEISSKVKINLPHSPTFGSTSQTNSDLVISPNLFLFPDSW